MAPALLCNPQDRFLEEYEHASYNDRQFNPCAPRQREKGIHFKRPRAPQHAVDRTSGSSIRVPHLGVGGVVAGPSLTDREGEISMPMMALIAGVAMALIIAATPRKN